MALMASISEALNKAVDWFTVGTLAWLLSKFCMDSSRDGNPGFGSRQNPSKLADAMDVQAGAAGLQYPDYPGRKWPC
ncbi:hypothetical protein GCM10027066_16420 [Dyella jejuensis]